MKRKTWVLGVSALAIAAAVVAVLAYAFREPPESVPADLAKNEVVPVVTPPDQEATKEEKQQREPAMTGPTIRRAQEIKTRPPGHIKASLSELHGLLTDKAQPAALRNTVANRLGEVRDKELPVALRQMLVDEKEWPKWRGYCVQQLGECYLRGQQREECLDAIFKATEIEEPQVQSTAIWNLALLATSRQVSKRPPAKRIAEARREIVRALGEEDLDEDVKLAAVIAAGQMEITEALPTVRAMVADEKTSKPYRLRAVTVLGKLGDESDLDLLAKAASDGSKRLKMIVATAVNRIKARAEVEKPKTPAPEDGPPHEKKKF